MVVPQTATVEQRLLEALKRGDLEGYLRALSDTHLLVFGSRRLADEGFDDPRAPLGLVQDIGGQDKVYAVTPNQTVDPGPHFVYHAMTLRTMLRKCAPLTWQLVVNQGSDHEGRIPVKKLASWVDNHPEAIRPFSDYGDRLIAADNRPRQGPLAAALACGAHLAVQNEAPWNTIGHVYKDYPADVRLMREGWRITEYDHWRAAVENLLTDPGSAAEAVGKDPGAVARHLAALRSDGIWEAEAGDAPPDVRAWDYGRAVNLARWAAATKLCDMDEARETVQRAGQLAAAAYRDWREFSAGYILGRLLHFEDGDRSRYYRSIRRVHRILAEDPASPWRTLNLADAAA
ncbi:DUF1266 domain-containing protein [Actinospica sp. MGRD01-02]|uniref:DUF1266 domain-containing protein n=1 Tax=Actinospica acidithermotolerans TaxID=2828514 RepID=A0A941EF16_9ACTN|nr:DUF1266 domain-containing protein [Actinospica acidithermotolerans]MBR7829345.1 DUF1266 domain-containing protein [Actinospica acidithermotolerans]